MPLYEHVFISRQDLSNAQAEGLVEHFGIVLKDNGGTVVDSEYWGLKTMAYKMNKNRRLIKIHKNRTFQLCVEFSLAPTAHS